MGSAIGSVLSIAGVTGTLLGWLAAGALDELSDGDFGRPCSDDGGSSAGAGAGEGALSAE